LPIAFSFLLKLSHTFLGGFITHLLKQYHIANLPSDKRCTLLNFTNIHSFNFYVAVGLHPPLNNATKVLMNNQLALSGFTPQDAHPAP